MACFSHPVEAQRNKPDTTVVEDREFLRLLQQSKELDEEQKWRAKRTTNVRVLRRLADDEDRGVRFFVAFNKSTPADALLKLSDDPNERF
ncbi:MAG: hypothetical protein ACO36I_19945 [Candidatus Latescibacterota bacterium]